MKKDIIYIDVEDDITSVIAKLKQSTSKIVAVVPPKRASVLSSVVNLKLLRKAAADTKKQLVLVTADSGLISLAAGLEMYVAKNLTTPPEIPDTNNKGPNLPSSTISADDSSAAAMVGAVASESENPETEVTPPEMSKKPKMAPISKGKLPNFARFRKRIFIGVALVLALIFAWYQAFFVMPRAEVTLRGQVSNVRSEFDLTLSTEASEVDLEAGIIPAQEVSLESTRSSEVIATGEVNKGDRATGTITIENCDDDDPVTFVSGTRVQSSSGEVFTLNGSVTVPGADFSGGGCATPGEANVGVTAAEQGDSYNIAATSYEFVNLSSGAFTITGSAMSGGSDDIVKVVTQEDVQTALDSLGGEASTLEITGQLKEQAGESKYVFKETLRTEVSEPKLDQPVGTEIDRTQVTVVSTNYALAVERSELEQVLTDQYKQQIGDQQAITDTGIDDLITDFNNESITIVSIVANGKAGPNVNTEELAQRLTKVKLGEALTITENLPGVVESSIDLSPFWVSSMPRSADKITIEISDPSS